MERKHFLKTSHLDGKPKIGGNSYTRGSNYWIVFATKLIQSVAEHCFLPPETCSRDQDRLLISCFQVPSINLIAG